MLERKISLENAVSLVKDGDTLVFGGWGVYRKPMAIVRAIARSSLKELTVITMGGLDADLLIAAGKVRKVIYGFIGYQQVPGIPPNCRRVRQDGSVEMMELSEGMLVVGLQAAASRLPFIPTRSGLGTDILTMNPGIKMLECPYTGAKLVAMPALQADVAFIHVNAASTTGYGQIIGEPWLDRIMARAAKKTVISTEKLMPMGELQKDYFSMQLLRVWLDSVVEIPYGAHPTGCYPQYGIDEEKIREYGQASASPDTLKAYMDKYVLSVTNNRKYVELMGGPSRLSCIKY